MKANFEKVVKKIESLDWKVDLGSDEDVFLQIYSPAGQDFSFSVEMGESIDAFMENLYKYYDSFDISYETYLWLDSDGHGKNGAPYDMRDAYDDMEWCVNSVLNLYDELNKEF